MITSTATIQHHNGEPVIESYKQSWHKRHFTSCLSPDW
jgi:hypothetical protein